MGSMLDECYMSWLTDGAHALNFRQKVWGRTHARRDRSRRNQCDHAQPIHRLTAMQCAEGYEE